jgi:hypothetical protein
MVPWHAVDGEGDIDESKNDKNSIVSIESEELIKQLRPTLGEILELGEEHENIALGVYYAMSPRGKIVLYWERIGSFFWHIMIDLIKNKRHQITVYELSKLAEATVAKTFYHEMFHHKSDLLTILFGSRKEYLREEAFAVAASYFEVKSCGGGWDYASHKLREDFLSLAYQYTAPGYRDWVNFKHRWHYEEEALEYVIHPVALRLLKLASEDCNDFFRHSLFRHARHELFDVSRYSDFVDYEVLPIISE